MKLNKKGQCPVCKRKPLTYKRDRELFCPKCDRAFSMDTGYLVNNWAWNDNNTKKVRVFLTD